MLPQAPRAPLGPSVTLNCGIPKRETATLFHRSAPASMDIFSSIVICARRSLIRDMGFSLFEISKADQLNSVFLDLLPNGRVGQDLQLGLTLFCIGGDAQKNRVYISGMAHDFKRAVLDLAEYFS